MTPVHYQQRRDVQRGLRELPWIAPEPADSGAVGHLFYYATSAWRRDRVAGLHIWTGGHGPTKGMNTKILWMAYGKPISGAMTVTGRRLGRPGRFTQHIDFGPSIVNVPRPGCWRLTLKTAEVTLHLTLRAVRPS